MLKAWFSPAHALPAPPGMLDELDDEELLDDELDEDDELLDEDDEEELLEGTVQPCATSWLRITWRAFGLVTWLNALVRPSQPWLWAPAGRRPTTATVATVNAPRTTTAEPRPFNLLLRLIPLRPSRLGRNATSGPYPLA